MKPQIKKQQVRYQLQYRSGSRWVKVTDHPTRESAEAYAKQSSSCQRNGYQIVRFLVKGTNQNGLKQRA